MEEPGLSFSVLPEDIRANNDYVDVRAIFDDERIEELGDGPNDARVDELGEDTLHDTISPMFTNLDNGAINTMPESINFPRVSLGDGLSELRIGLRYGSKEELKNEVKRHSIRHHQHFMVVETTPAIWALKCKKHIDGCTWRLRACLRKSHGMWEITQYRGSHTCVYSRLSQDHDQITSGLIAREIQHVVKCEPSITIATLQQILKDKFGYIVHYWKVWDGKRKTLVHAFGDWEQSFNLLPRWMNILEIKNPGTQIEWKLEEMSMRGNAVLERVFWSFGPCIEGFKHCRPVIQIDGTHLYGKYNGKLLIATSIDSNGHIFPLAFALVDEESAITWGWFLYLLRHKVTQREGICLVSDRHGGIISAVNDASNGWLEPHAYHRFCLRHVASNFNNKYKSKLLKELVYRAGAEFQVRKFEERMNELAKANKDCLQFFNNISIEKWTQSHDGGHRFGWMTTNIAECINGVLKGGRMLPITALVQMTFYRCVGYFQIQRSEALDALEKREEYTRYAVMKIIEWEARASSHKVIMFDREEGYFEVKTGVYQMTNKGGNEHIVKLNDRTCTCNKWQVFGISCSHVIVCCKLYHLDYWKFVDDYYLMSSYSATYAPKFHPIPHQDYWPDPNFVILHPDESQIREKGRPRSTRIRNEMDWKESSSKQRCGLCRQEGHNKRKCPQRNMRSS